MGNGAECPDPQGPLWGRDSLWAHDIGTGALTGSALRRKIRQNPYKIPHFKGGYRREARISLLKNISAPKLAAAAEAGRYGGGIIIAPEYRPAAGACRSRDAPSAQLAISDQRLALKRRAITLRQAQGDR